MHRAGFLYSSKSVDIKHYSGIHSTAVLAGLNGIHMKQPTMLPSYLLCWKASKCSIKGYFDGNQIPWFAKLPGTTYQYCDYTSGTNSDILMDIEAWSKMADTCKTTFPKHFWVESIRYNTTNGYEQDKQSYWWLRGSEHNSQHWYWRNLFLSKSNQAQCTDKVFLHCYCPWNGTYIQQQ